MGFDFSRAYLQLAPVPTYRCFDPTFDAISIVSFPRLIFRLAHGVLICFTLIDACSGGMSLSFSRYSDSDFQLFDQVRPDHHV